MILIFILVLIGSCLVTNFVYSYLLFYEVRKRKQIEKVILSNFIIKIWLFIIIYQWRKVGQMSPTDKFEPFRYSRTFLQKIRKGRTSDKKILNLSFSKNCRSKKRHFAKKASLVQFFFGHFGKVTHWRFEVTLVWPSDAYPSTLTHFRKTFWPDFEYFGFSQIF